MQSCNPLKTCHEGHETNENIIGFVCLVDFVIFVVRI